MRRPPPPRGRSPLGPPPELPHEFAQARWRLFVRHRAGSLEALAASARNRNIAISGGLLLLILAIVGSLLRVSRQSQRLAESHMNFVAGVSHELRTPLTVIRTAAYNLRGKMANRPEQVEKYGKLIQEESEKLGALVEQVLQFASGQAGHVIREREPVAVESLIEDSLRGNIESMETRGIQLEKRIDTGLPPVLADRLAMKHALQNLVDNALKYATGSEPWIGVSASAISTGQGPGIEIRVADRGPGIPAEEQKHIFDPFFRGRRAVSDQVHGTGLGLNLARRIVEAHEGTLEVRSDVQTGAGTEFIVRIPAAPSELSHELAHSIG
jgi:signal transduction histidine kinase